MNKIGFGGSCHWCTEAIFRSLSGVIAVQQGWITAAGREVDYSEAVIVEFEEAMISLETLIEIHLRTHSSTSAHSFRTKYRSAIYTFDEVQASCSLAAINKLQPGFEQPIITEVLQFGSFKLNMEKYQDYYYSNPDKPFCRTFIDPKLKVLLDQFSGYVKEEVQVI
ncbi:peptide-methionine (S)-S-oxide reductase, partial [Dyadobacter sp.]|uniref:peptide-methionine (S)-S-oxide reductase n=1 Tax=Dyadobacter sp. TaxID=1914288 RepID=UPI003F71EB00